jgi:hypothetical protein
MPDSDIKTIKFYKVKNLRTGLYSTGGLYPGFNKTGKVWKSRSALMIHLSQFNNKQYAQCKNPYMDDDFIIEEEIFKKTSSSITNLRDEIERLQNKRDNK